MIVLVKLTQVSGTIVVAMSPKAFVSNMLSIGINLGGAPFFLISGISNGASIVFVSFILKREYTFRTSCTSTNCKAFVVLIA